MLFISRYVAVHGDHHYGVVDSEDNVEEVVSVQELEKAVNNGITIAGVEVAKRCDADDYYISTVSIYWGTLLKTPASAKAYTLYGIEIYAWNGYLSKIFWNSARITSPVSLKLSDYGHTLCDYFLSSVQISSFTELKYDMIFVLDDSVAVSPNAFYINGRKYTIPFVGRLVVDLTQVTRDSSAEVVYAGMRKVIALNKDNSLCAIRDNAERYNRLIGGR